MVSVCEELYPRHDGGKYDKDRRRELVEAGGKLRQAYEDLLKEPAFKAIISITSTRSVMERFRMFKKDVLAKVEQGCVQNAGCYASGACLSQLPSRHVRQTVQ